MAAFPSGGLVLSPEAMDLLKRQSLYQSPFLLREAREPQALFSSRFFGVPVYHSHRLPMSRVTLSEGVDVSLEFRTKYQRWLNDFFGTTEGVLLHD